MRVASLLWRRNSYPKRPFGAAHRLYLDTPPLKGLRLEPFGSIRNHREESMRCALSRFYPEPAALA